MGASDRARLLLLAAVAEAMHHVGEDTLGEAQRRAPVEEGTLRGSGELELEQHPDRITATVSFNTIYAARQHEETEWHHPKGGQAKYLESVVAERAPRYQAVLAAAARRALSR